MEKQEIVEFKPASKRKPGTKSRTNKCKHSIMRRM